MKKLNSITSGNSSELANKLKLIRSRHSGVKKEYRMSLYETLGLAAIASRRIARNAADRSAVGKALDLTLERESSQREILVEVCSYLQKRPKGSKIIARHVRVILHLLDVEKISPKHVEDNLKKRGLQAIDNQGAATRASKSMPAADIRLSFSMPIKRIKRLLKFKHGKITLNYTATDKSKLLLTYRGSKPESAAEHAH